MKRRPAGSFRGDDSEYLDKVDVYLEQLSLTTEYSDAELVDWGKGFCSVISSGGLLADKVNFWGGVTQIDVDTSGAIFKAAGDVYCPDSFASYVDIRTADNPGKPSPRDEADLVRSYAAIVANQISTPVEDLTDAQLRREGHLLCATDLAQGWSSRPEVQPLRHDYSAPLIMSYVSALVAVYCPAAIPLSARELADFIAR